MEDSKEKKKRKRGMVLTSNGGRVEYLKKVLSSAEKDTSRPIRVFKSEWVQTPKRSTQLWEGSAKGRLGASARKKTQNLPERDRKRKKRANEITVRGRNYFASEGQQGKGEGPTSRPGTREKGMRPLSGRKRTGLKFGKAEWLPHGGGGCGTRVQRVLR